METTQQTLTQQVIEQHDKFLCNAYGRYPRAFIHGQGCELFDAEGKRYLDLFAGFGASILGHCHPDLIKAVTEQAQKLWHVGNQYYTQPQNHVAQAIAEAGFGGQSFFCHSGADANEAAIKLARLFGRANPGSVRHRFRIITAEKSFHGRTLGTMVATGQPKVREGFDPFPEGFVQVPFNDLIAMSEAVDQKTVAIMVEPIQGEGGVVVPNEDYLPGLRRLCDQHDLLLICDEVWTGCGRTGRMFAHQHWLADGQEPDIMTLAKGVGAGLAVGVMCAKPDVAALFDWRKYGRAVHATTLGANCLSMAASAALFDVLNRDALVQKAAKLGQYIVDRFVALAKKYPPVKDVRGKGLLIGIELDPARDGAWFDSASDVVNRAMDKGVMINVAQENVLRLAPPLVITREQLDEGLDLLEAVIRGD